MPIFIILIGACVAMFFATKQMKDRKTGNNDVDRVVGIMAGVINGVVIAAINFIYQTLANLFVTLENHKYQDTYERSYIFKLFLFKFINTNITLFYTAFYDRNFNELYYLIIGMVIQKVI